MKRFLEILFYVTFAAGMAFGTSSFTLISGLFEISALPWVVLSIVLSGGLCIVISSSIAELASMYPSAPGIRTYLKVALPNPVSLLLVYLYLIFMVLIAGVESFMFALVSVSVFPQVDPIYVVLGLLAFTVAVNLIGFELPRLLQIIATSTLVLTVLIVAGLGMAHGHSSVLIQGSSVKQWASLPGAIGLGIYLYVGFEWTTMLGFRPESYKRAIPLSMPLAILVNMIAYSCFAIALAAIVAPGQIIGNSIPQVIYFQTLLGGAGPLLAMGLSLLAVFGTFNAGVMGGARLIFILSREGSLPEWCGTMSLTTGAPIGGVLTLGSLATVCSVLVVEYKLQLMAAVIGSCIASFVYAAFLWSALKLRRTKPNLKRPFTSSVPRWVQVAMIVFMPIIGVLSLFSEPSLHLKPVFGLGAAVVIAGVGAFASSERTRKLPAGAGRTKAAMG